MDFKSSLMAVSLALLQRSGHATFIVAADGRIRGNAETRDLIELLAAVEPIRQHIDAAYAGALVARVFKHNPWLESMTIRLHAPEGLSGSTRISISHAVAVTGIKPPRSVCGVHGYDADLANDDIGEYLADEAPEIADGFRDDRDEAIDLEFNVTRRSIAGLLACELGMG